MRRTSRTVILVVVGLMGAVTLHGLWEPGSPSAETQSAGPTAQLTAPAGPTPADTQASPVPDDDRLAVVLSLEVKGRAPKTGYDRALFGQAWQDVDRNGCDTRNDILRRDLTDLVVKAGTNGCVALSGTLVDPFSGAVIDFARGGSQVQIDHVVPLMDAWQKGAQAWDAEKRARFANDPANLLAVSTKLNSQKSDGDAATWLPPNKAFRCDYVARQATVKHAYGLWTTQAERDAMVRVLSSC